MGGAIFTLSVLLSILTDAAYALLVGTLLAARWWDAVDGAAASSSSARARWPQRFILLIGVLLTGAHCVRPWFLAASMSGSTSLHDNLVLIPTILASTHQGALWYWNCGALLVLFGGVALMGKSRGVAHGGLLTAVFLLACVKAATGHAADQGDFTLVEGLQAVHILATAVWAGSVLVAGFFVLPRIAQAADPAAVWRYMEHLSSAATYALIAVLVSGVYTSARALNNSLAGVGSSPWGRILLVKVLCVVLALSLGAYCRFRYLSHEASNNGARWLVILLRWEAIVMTAILLLSGLLGNSAPPMSHV